jgi:hypothetical protein
MSSGSETTLSFLYSADRPGFETNKSTTCISDLNENYLETTFFAVVRFDKLIFKI